MKHGLKTLLLGGAATLAGTASPALAQNDPAAGSDASGDIIVTAQRRAESIQNVPLSISAIPRAALISRGIQSVNDIAANIPNITFQPSNSNRTVRITARGIVSEGNNVGIEQSIPFSVDGVAQGRPTFISGQLYDVERIEALRGPQGTLYGMNAIAGAINVITVAPELDKLGGFVRASYGNYDAVSGEGAINLPLANGLAALRASGSYARNDGFQYNRTRNDRANSTNGRAGRLALRIGSGPVDFTVRAFASHDRPRINAFDQSSPYSAAAIAAGVVANPSAYDDVVTNNYRSYANRDIWGFNGTFDIDAGPVTITSITAFQGYKYQDRVDNDYTNLDVAVGGLDEKQLQFSQELRLVSNDTTPLSYVAGAYYYYQRVHYSIFNRFGPAIVPVFGLPPAFAASFPQESTLVDSRLYTDNYGLFAQASYNFTDALRVTGGVRYSWDRKKLSYLQAANAIAGFPLLSTATGTAATALIPDRTDSDRLQWTVSADYHANDNLLLFGRVSTGFKAGGFNVSTNSNNQIVYLPEKLTAYEAGLKLQLFDRRAYLNLTGFRYNYRDLQVNTFVVPPTGGIGRVQASNAAQARTEGLELEAGAKAANWLSLYGSWGWTPTARYTRYTATATANYQGNRIQLAYRNNVSLGADVTGPDMGWGGLFANANLQYRSRAFRNPDNNPLLIVNAMTVVNARVGIRASERWEVSAWGRNLFDDRYSQTAVPNSFTGGTALILGDPRTYGVEARLSF